MSIPKHIRDNYTTMLAAAASGDLALLECKDAITGEPRYVVCAVNTKEGDYLFVPFGHMESEMNPYDRYLPPE